MFMLEEEEENYFLALCSISLSFKQIEFKAKEVNPNETKSTTKKIRRAKNRMKISKLSMVNPKKWP